MEKKNLEIKSLPGGKYSFWALLCACKIEIPIIQRDYAHGRDTEQARQVRETLVKKIITAALDKDKKEPVFLQYVYGNVTEAGSFVPVDGQQRLTTLFLLHLYCIETSRWAQTNKDVMIGSDSGRICSFCLCLLKKMLSGFSYRTRATSNDFCRALIGHDLLAGVSIQPKNNDEVGTVSRWIKDQNWFMEQWRRDPTVDGMLRSLDTIHKIFWSHCKTPCEAMLKSMALLKSLLADDQENFIVLFDVLDMRQAGLSDDLYLKMNARGLPLTPLENLKSAIEKFYTPPHKPTSADCILELANDWSEKDKCFRKRTYSLSSAKAFSMMMDGAWLDAVWQCEKGQKDLVSSADGSMLVLLMRFCVFSAAAHDRIVSKEEAKKLNDCRQSLCELLKMPNRNAESIKEKEGEIQRIELRNDIEDRIIPICGAERFIPFSILKRVLMDNRDVVLRDVSKWFNRFVQYRDLMLTGLDPYWKCNPTSDKNTTWHSFLAKFKNGQPAWKEMSILFAALAYFEYGASLCNEKMENGQVEYRKWMHFSWNLIENSHIDDIDSFAEFAQVVSFHAHRILDRKDIGICAYLQHAEYFFNDKKVESAGDLVGKHLSTTSLATQFAEEVIKVRLVAEKDADICIRELLTLEKRPWLKGRIRIVFTSDGEINRDLLTVLSGLGDEVQRKEWLYSVICAREYEYQRNPSWVHPLYISSVMAKNRDAGDPALKAFLYDSHYIELVRRCSFGRWPDNGESAWLTRIGDEQWTAIREIRSYQQTGGVYAYTTSDIRSSYRIDDGIKWWHDLVNFADAKCNWMTQDQGGWVSCRIGGDDFALCQYDHPFVQILSKEEWVPTVKEAMEMERSHKWISNGDFHSLIVMLRNLKKNRAGE